MESAPARAQSRIPPFRLSKTVQPAPHKGQRRWLPHFSGQSSSADAKNGAKKRVFPKCLLSPRGTRAAGHSVSTHTMLRAALKHAWSEDRTRKIVVSTHTMLRAALKPTNLLRLDVLYAVSTHTMLRAALTLSGRRSRCDVDEGLDTHNAACGIDSKTALRVLLVTQSRFVCKNRTAILTMRRTDDRIEIQKGTA